MTVFVDALMETLNVPEGRREELLEKLAEARVRVDKYVDDYTSPEVEVPEAVLNGAYQACTEDLWNRHNAPFGIVNTQYASGIGDAATPIRISRDPLTVVRPLLAQWCYEPGIA